MNVGLYFGSFNPVHIGHLIIASYAKHTTTLQQVWMVVSPHNPLKHSASLLNEYDRLHLVNLAIHNDASLRATDIEFKLPRPSYTVNTLVALQEKYPQHTFSIIMGGDSFSNLTKWRNYEYIIRHHKIYVFNRPGFEVTDTLGANVEFITAPLLQISSTTIRDMIAKGIPIRYLVPDTVDKEIEQSRYYKT